MKKLILILMIGSLFSNNKIAVIDLSTDEDISNEISASALIDRLTTEIFNLGVYQVLERKDIKKVLDEYKFQLTSGAVNQDEAIALGSIMGAKYIVLGSISQIGNFFSISVRMVDVETSIHYKAASYDCPNTIKYLLTEGMYEIALKLSGLTPEKESLRDDSKEVPEWIIHTPISDKYIYSVGIGEGLEEALVNSLYKLKSSKDKHQAMKKETSEKTSNNSVINFSNSVSSSSGDRTFGKVNFEFLEKEFEEKVSLEIDDDLIESYYSKAMKLVYKNKKETFSIKSFLEIKSGELINYVEKKATNCELDDIIKELEANGCIIKNNYLDDKMHYYLLLKVEKSKLK